MDDELRQMLSLLNVQAQFLTDIEGTRTAAGNRAFALQDRFGLPEDHPKTASARTLEAELLALEKRVVKDLEAALRQVPFYPAIKAMIGVGDKQAARLLGAIFHPRWKYDRDQEIWVPRTVGQLWSYCGYAPVLANGHYIHATHKPVAVRIAAKRRRGEQSQYNAEARTRAFLISESCIKQRHSPYRAVYDAGRLKYAESIHEVPCPQCGPKGHPAQPGSDLSDGHKHARALRLVAKDVLKDLWIRSDEDYGALDLAA